MLLNFYKSIFFHLTVALFVLYISDFLNFNKKNLETEIPIEVLDIADITKVKKKERSKPENNKKNTQEKFSPPKIISKPTPPNLAEKKNKKEVKKKNEKNLEENKKINRLSSILKSINEIKVDKSVKKKNDIKKDIENDTMLSDEKLTISEVDLIRRQFISCWNVPAGAKDIKNLKVLIKINLDREGNVVGSKMLSKLNSNNPFYRAAAESALRAVKHPGCKKLKVPKKKYESWQNIILNFDPSMF